MAYYENIFRDLGIDESAPGAAIMTHMVNTIYDEMDNMRAECKKNFDDAWQCVKTCMNPTIRYIRLMSYYQYMGIMLNRHQFFGQFSDILRTCAQLKAANANTNYWDSPLDNAAIQFMQKHYEILFENDKKADVDHMNTVIDGDEKAGNESIVTAYAPIAPYVGTIRTPFAGIIKEMEDPEGDEIEQDKETAATEGQHIVFNDERIKKKALWQFVLIFNDCERFESVLQHRQEITSMYLKYGKYFVREMHHIYPIGVTEFILYSNLVANPDLFPKAMKFMIVDQDYQYKFGHDGYERDMNRPLADAMEAYDALLGEATYCTEDELTADTNRVLASAKHLINQALVQEKELQHDQDIKHDNVIVPGDKQHTFNLNRLMNFIYESRRYIPSRNTTMLLEKVAVKTISFVNGYLIIEPDLGTKPSEYIYVPVVDTLNGRRMCVVRYHRESEVIDVLSVHQYVEIVRDVTGPEVPKPNPDPNETENDEDYTDPASGT